MPTLPGRETLRDRAVRSFTMQDVPEGWNISLRTDLDREPSLGKKLNRMISQSSADLFVLLDDDDWHSPSRVVRQIEPLLKGEAEITGTSKIYYFDFEKGVTWLYAGNPRNWVGGLAFRRELWDRCKFDDLSSGVDYRWQHKTKAKIFDLGDPCLFVAGMHSGNTCKKDTSTEQWHQLADTSDLPAAFLNSLGTATSVPAMRDRQNTPESAIA